MPRSIGGRAVTSAGGGLLVGVLLLSTTALAAPSKGPTCSFTSAGGTLTATVVLKHSTLGSNVTLSVSKSGLPGGPVTTTTRVFRGHQSFLVLTATRATTGALDATAQLGAGFHGVRTMMLTSGDGMTFNGTVDGQALLPFSANTTPSAVQLVGGRAVPKVRIKRAARALFRKLGQVDFQSS